MVILKQTQYVYEETLQFEDENGVLNPVTFDVKITPEEAHEILTITRNGAKIETLSDEETEKLKDLLFNNQYKKVGEAFGEYYAEHFLIQVYSDFLGKEGVKIQQIAVSAASRSNKNSNKHLK